MIKQWISWINLALIGFGIFLLLLSLWFLFSRPSQISFVEVQEPKTTLPKRAFTSSEQAYADVENHLLHLSFTPMTIQLPDLRRFLIYYGKNGRPDAQNGTLLHFGWNGGKETAAIEANQKLFLVYDGKTSPGKYSFSPSNESTPLWIEAQPSGDEALVRVGMLDDKGNLVREPANNLQFNLKAREFARTIGNWEIGNQRVDGTLLARQKARWFGKDKFFERHGGEEYKDFVGKERIDFGESPDGYSIYANAGDIFIWDGNRWKSVKPGKDSLGHPLLVVKQIDERLMKFDLWDAEGKGTITLNLLKSAEPRSLQNIEKHFKFLGARTRSQFVFEIDGERVLLSPYDWLLQSDGTWKKLTTAQEIDDYVDRKTIGPLFVFDGLKKVGDQQVLSGVVFNTTRSDFQTIELPIQQTGGSTVKEDSRGKKDESSSKNIRPKNKVDARQSNIKTEENETQDHSAE
ncbi:putative uncharacterized protein [Parachlamydia acanthamoebae UV-7]|jgi:hypothetical protein|uniref:Uncharacterized protein n=2 Tax=Parachlamydia acanthamoebae TaxID=83552 RepID=F8L2J8_PARAV|nr:hypothetical protein [Parachlamydia acanthamoebae]EFB40297.1 hypothetical protein pah_c209o020 [Parachlamydia acanthamoebae str. Hall's coccus]KIA76803.1 hypothetical protein DB43_HJ00140 [Parachlamydia acanthamoebae]CCB87518.1 putative uncharacterized protein [Parachlamydia acanthamoebae UV-7]